MRTLRQFLAVEQIHLFTHLDTVIRRPHLKRIEINSHSIRETYNRGSLRNSPTRQATVAFPGSLLPLRNRQGL